MVYVRFNCKVLYFQKLKFNGLALLIKKREKSLIFTKRLFINDLLKPRKLSYPQKEKYVAPSLVNI